MTAERLHAIDNTQLVACWSLTDHRVVSMVSRHRSAANQHMSRDLAPPYPLTSARRCAIAVDAVAMCLSVCHKPVLCQNGENYYHADSAAQ